MKNLTIRDDGVTMTPFQRWVVTGNTNKGQYSERYFWTRSQARQYIRKNNKSR